MFTRENLNSYLAYLGAGGSAVAIEQKVIKESSIKVTDSIAAKTAEQAPWLADIAPNAIQSGALVVKDGHLFVYGLSLLEVASLVVLTLTFLFTIGKFIMDYLTYRMNMKDKSCPIPDKEEEAVIEEVVCECGNIIPLTKKES